MNQHKSEPWHVEKFCGRVFINDKNSKCIAEMTPTGDEADYEYACHIVACVNACFDVPSSAQEGVSESPVHRMFGLSYASWFVWPRVVMQAMPFEWQKRFEQLTNELNGKFPDWEPQGRFCVQIKNNGKFIKLPNELTEYRRPVDKYKASSI